MAEHPDAETETLTALLDEWLSWELEQHPVRATALGVEGYDHRLADHSAEAYQVRSRGERDWRRRFENVDPGPELDDQLDQELAIAELRGREIRHDREEWRRNPDAYIGECLYGVFHLFLQRLRPEPELVDAAVARLSAVPAVLDHGRSNLDASMASPLLVRRSLGMCQAGVAYTRELLPAEVSDEHLRGRLIEAGAHAADAFAEFAGFLETLADEASGSFAIGEERYSALLEEAEGLGYGAGELHRRGQESYDTLSADMGRRAREIEGTDDFRAVIETINEDHPATPEEMRDLYAEWTQRARDFLGERELVSFPDGERCEVVPSPSFQRPVLAVASYMRPPAFTESRVGHFFVPFPPEGSTLDEINQRLAMNSRAIIPSISVHEAYPGHHWHLAVAAGNPRAVRKMFGTPYFAEGWGLYTEQMMREQGFFPDPRMELLQLDMRLFRAARIIVDTALHCDGLPPDAAVTTMQEKAGLSEPVARAEVARYCAWPTQASAYLTGSLEIERMRDEYLGAGKGSLRDFHDTIASSGVLPLRLAERAVMEG